VAAAQPARGLRVPVDQGRVGGGVSLLSLMMSLERTRKSGGQAGGPRTGGDLAISSVALPCTHNHRVSDYSKTHLH